MNITFMTISHFKNLADKVVGIDNLKILYTKVGRVIWKAFERSIQK